MKRTLQHIIRVGLLLIGLSIVLSGCEVFVGDHGHDHDHEWHHDGDWDHR